MPKSETLKYEEDLRCAPARETDSRDELLKRADMLAQADVGGGAPRREEPTDQNSRQ